MTDNNHPITPPPELVKQWQLEGQHHTYETPLSTHIATQAARWGADQELEACLDEIYKGVGLRLIPYGSHRELLCSDLRAFRRHKPPSLKEQAFELVDRIEKAESVWAMSELDIIRRALESLPD